MAQSEKPIWFPTPNCINLHFPSMERLERLQGEPEKSHTSFLVAARPLTRRLRFIATLGRDQQRQQQQQLQHTWHADTAESSSFIQTSSIVLAGIRVAFIDVDFASRSGESARAITTERSRSIDAESVVFARRAGLALVDILSAIDTFVSVRARTHVRAVDRTRVADGASVARIRGACIIQMAQQSGFTYSSSIIYHYQSMENRFFLLLSFFFSSLFLPHLFSS